MASSWASGLVCVSVAGTMLYGRRLLTGHIRTGQIDREGNARKVVNCSCVVVKDWGEESQERSVLLNYFQTEQ
jgi:hypothetical protein